MLTFLRKKMKTIMIVVAVLFVASMFYGISATRWRGGGGETSRDLAKVNGKAIDPLRYREMFSRMVNQLGGEIRPQDAAFVQNLALGQTIDFTLILDQAKKKVKVPNREVDAVIDNLVQQQKLGSKKELERILKRSGLSMGKFKEMIRDEMLVQKMVSKVRGDAKVTPEDLREVRASHILLSSEADAKRVLEKVRKGEDFSALAREYSMDPGSAGKGGDLGYFTTGSMIEPFEKKAFSLKVGEVSDAVKTQFGYHIIKVTDTRLREFGDKKEDVEKAALQEKQEKAFQRWFSDLKSKARIEIISPELKAHDLRFRGKAWEAIQEYKKAISQNPYNPYLHLYLADCYGSVGKTDDALSEYQAAVEAGKGEPLLYLILAEAYQKAGKTDQAIAQYRLASMVAGDDKALHERLLKTFRDLRAGAEVAREKAEILRIEKKEKFEKELKGEGK
jgi:foldase protein PrsA